MSAPAPQPAPKTSKSKKGGSGWVKAVAIAVTVLVAFMVLAPAKAYWELPMYPAEPGSTPTPVINYTGTFTPPPPPVNTSLPPPPSGGTTTTATYTVPAGTTTITYSVPYMYRASLALLDKEKNIVAKWGLFAIVKKPVKYLDSTITFYNEEVVEPVVALHVCIISSPDYHGEHVVYKPKVMDATYKAAIASMYADEEGVTIPGVGVFAAIGNPDMGGSYGLCFTLRRDGWEMHAGIDLEKFMKTYAAYGGNAVGEWKLVVYVTAGGRHIDPQHPGNYLPGALISKKIVLMFEYDGENVYWISEG